MLRRAEAPLDERAVVVELLLGFLEIFAGQLDIPLALGQLDLVFPLDVLALVEPCQRQDQLGLGVLGLGLVLLHLQLFLGHLGLAVGRLVLHFLFGVLSSELLRAELTDDLVLADAGSFRQNLEDLDFLRFDLAADVDGFRAFQLRTLANGYGSNLPRRTSAVSWAVSSLGVVYQR